jgi:predicted RNase H-like nuclease (RuvC/YqgF family)
LTRRFNEAKENVEAYSKQNAGYRKAIVTNEAQMQAYATEVNDLRKNLAIQKTEQERLRDENAAYKR